jgi:hypothetical protein
MRWRWPPENSCGYLSRSLARRPTDSSASAARLRCSAGLVPPCSGQRLGHDALRRSGAGPASHRGPETPSGSRAAPRAARRRQCGRSRPSSSTLPALGVSSAITSAPAWICPSPIRPRCPGCGPASQMVKLTPLSACTVGGGPQGFHAAAGSSRARLTLQQGRASCGSCGPVGTQQAATSVQGCIGARWWRRGHLRRWQAWHRARWAAPGKRATGGQVDQLGHRAGNGGQRCRAPQPRLRPRANRPRV